MIKFLIVTLQVIIIYKNNKKKLTPEMFSI